MVCFLCKCGGNFRQQYKSINLYHYGFSIVAEGVIIAYLNGCLDSMIISSLILVAS